MPDDKAFDGPTGQRHKFIADYWMTLSFILSATEKVDGSYPEYLLESTDGVYSQRLSAGSDLTPYGDYMQLQFKKLARGSNYKLTRFLDEDWSEVVFDNLPFAQIVDQDRAIHDALKDHTYGELEVDLGSSVDAITWQAPPDGSQDDLSDVVL